MNDNKRKMDMRVEETRPWWSVRTALLASLVLLVILLVALLAQPQLLDHGFRFAGL